MEDGKCERARADPERQGNEDGERQSPGSRDQADRRTQIIVNASDHQLATHIQKGSPCPFRLHCQYVLAERIVQPSVSGTLCPELSNQVIKAPRVTPNSDPKYSATP